MGLETELEKPSDQASDNTIILATTAPTSSATTASASTCVPSSLHAMASTSPPLVLKPIVPPTTVPSNEGNASPNLSRGLLSSARASGSAVSRAVFPRPATCSPRKDKKIRDLEEYMGWFSSVGSLPLKTPVEYDDAEFADVYVHSYGEGQHQVWIRTASATWQPVNPGHAHPYLPGYQLILKNDRPTWVTKKTLATYHYRK